MCERDSVENFLTHSRSISLFAKVSFTSATRNLHAACTVILLNACLSKICQFVDHIQDITTKPDSIELVCTVFTK